MKQYGLGASFRILLLLGAVVAACNTMPDDKSTMGHSGNINRSDSANPSVATFEKDADFAVTAADGGLLEIALGQLAQQNGQLQQVKEFGLMMINDHSAANNELRALAEQKSISLPDSLSDRLKKKYTMLQALKGAAFDKKYLLQMVTDHEDDLNIFRKYTDNGADQHLVQWARGKIPVLQLHLQHAREVERLLK